MSDFKYPKAEKLKKDTEITLLFAKGKWRSCGNLRIIILKNHQDLQNENVKLGVSVSKRYFKKAVHRNRIKRLLRECYRLNKDLFVEKFGANSLSMLFWVSTEKPAHFSVVEKNFLKLCESIK